MIQILSISTIAVDGNLILYYPPSLRHCEERSDVAVSFSATHTLFLYLCILIYLFIRIFLLIFESVIANLPKAGVAITYSITHIHILSYVFAFLSLSLRVGFGLRGNLIHIHPHLLSLHYTNIYSHSNCLKPFKIGNNNIKWL